MNLKPWRMTLAVGSTVTLLPLLTLRAEPRHHWPLDETSGLVAADVASGSDAALVNFNNNDDSHWVDGEVGGALSLGTGSTLGNHLAVDLPAMSAAATGGFTIMMWIKPGDIVGRPGEYQLFTSPGDGIGFTIYNDTFQGRVHNRVLLFWDGSLSHIAVGSTRLQPGQWYHVAVTTRGVGGERQLYVNGSVEAKRFFVAQGGVDLGHGDGWPAGQARIGAFNSAGGRWHDSTVDDVRIYDTALSEEEIFEVFSFEPAPPLFARGDANSDSKIDLADGIVILNHLYLGAPPPACLDASDVDDDGGNLPTIADAIRLFSWLYSGGPPPADPAPVAAEYASADCGRDTTADEMDCETPSGKCS
jgi:hypothetical protein